MAMQRWIHLAGVILGIVLSGVHSVSAHDTWVEANTNVVRAGDSVLIDLKLGNHGNDHRDFKIAGKVGLEACTLEMVMPNGIHLDLLPNLVDQGYAPNEGYWSTKFSTRFAGTHLVAHTFDKVVNHGRPTRSIKSAKTFFLTGLLLDRLKDDSTLWKQPLGHPLEIVPVSHPVLWTGPGMPIEVQVNWKGQPLPEARVSFIPQGTELKPEFDETYERRTGADGRATFTPKAGNRYLIVTHQTVDEEQGTDYQRTSYAATLQLLVSDLCPCCQ